MSHSVSLKLISFFSFGFNWQNVHQGYVTETLMRFLKARDWDPSKAYKMVKWPFLLDFAREYFTVAT